MFECSKETGIFLKKYLLFIEYRNIESIHCFPLLNVIKSHENLMPGIGHDFAVVDFESAGQFLNNRGTLCRSLIFLIAVLCGEASHILPARAELKKEQRVIVFQCGILNPRRRLNVMIDS